MKAELSRTCRNPTSERRARPRAHPLGLHRRAPRGVSRLGLLPAAVAQCVLGQIAWEPEGVVEGEQELAVDGAAPARSVRLVELLDAPLAAVEGVRESFLLSLDSVLHARPFALQLGIGVCHHCSDPLDAPVEEGLGEAEEAAVEHGPAHDPAQDVAPPLVRRGHPVGDEERRRPRVVGDDPQRDVVLGVPPVRLAGQLRGPVDERAQEIRVVVRRFALEHRGDALQPHAGVDRRPGQRAHGPAGVAVVLHEHEVPDLEPAVALAGRAETRAAGRHLGARQVIALVEVDLRAGAAGAGLAHGPEVVLLAQTEDAVVAEAGHLFPQRERVVVVGEHGGDQPGTIEGEVAGQELPREGDRVGLEVVAEREVAEHLEECVMAGGAPDVLEVVVLAARPYALLAGRRAAAVAPLLAEEHALELHHARSGEEQGGIVAGDERRRAHARVPLALEVPQERLAEERALHFPFILSAGQVTRSGGYGGSR